ncbi:MAG: hypothetical protein K2X87_30035 [Gemmataceae bacterium]|nr:hypothetical protein [Gemmataceae bacterium]
MTPRPRPVRLPPEDVIRRRLAALATEASTLRALLRLVRDRRPPVPCRGLANAR